MFQSTNSARKQLAMSLALCLVLLASPSLAAIYNCNTVTSSTGEVDDGQLKINDTPTLCIHFLPYQVKIGFRVTVDTNVALSVKNGFEVVKEADTDIAIQLSNSEKLSQQIVS
jgi:hypothetical protein